MGVLDSLGDIGSATLSDLAAPFKNIFSGPPVLYGADFPGGFTIEEQGGDELEINLVGEWLPHQPFEWGGKQQLTKQYYPGNPEPTVQVLGTRAANVRIKGRFKVKHLSSQDNVRFRTAPAALCDAIDGLKDRGSLVKISLGEWERWGFIEETKWMMKTLADINYEIDFFIVSDEEPSQCKLADDGLDIPTDDNLDLIAAAIALEQLGTNPGNVNLGLFAQLNSLIGSVASVLKVVTTFVDTAISTAQNVEALANRAIGLVKYAQAQISSYKRQVGALNAYFGSDPTTGLLKTWSEPQNAAQAAYVAKLQTATSAPQTPSAAQVAASTAKTSAYTPKASSQQLAAAKALGPSIDQILAKMLAAFTKIAQQLPIARYLVKSGDTLQKISLKFYGTSDNWLAIYKHNQLTSTILTPGVILEIPKK